MKSVQQMGGKLQQGVRCNAGNLEGDLRGQPSSVSAVSSHFASALGVFSVLDIIIGHVRL